MKREPKKSQKNTKGVLQKTKHLDIIKKLTNTAHLKRKIIMAITNKQSRNRMGGSRRPAKQVMLVIPTELYIPEDAEGIAQGFVCDVVYPKGTPNKKVIVQASAEFIAQKYESPNFPQSAKSATGKLNKSFYKALLIPNPSAPAANIRMKEDTVRIVVTETGNTVQLKGEDVLVPVVELTKYNWNVFSRGKRVEKDPVDETMEKVTPASEIIVGHGYVTCSYRENEVIKNIRMVYTPSFANEEELFAEMRKAVQTKYGKRISFSVEGNADEVWRYSYPSLSKEDRQMDPASQEVAERRYVANAIAETESEIQRFKDLGLSLDKINIFAEETFRFSKSNAEATMDGFLKDARYGIGLASIEEKEGKSIIVGEKDPETGEVKVAYKDGYAVHMAVARTFYFDKVTGELLPGSIRSATALSNDLKPIPSLTMTADEYQAYVERIANTAPAADAQAAEFEAPEQAPAAPAAAPAPSPMPSLDGDDDIPF